MTEKRKNRKRFSLNKIVAVACLTAVIASAVPTVSLSADAASAIYATTTEYLNLRTGAGTNYSVITVITKNTSVTVVDRSNNNWLKVQLSNGTTGYCSADYLNITTKAKTTAYLNLRTGAGTNYTVKQLISPNVTLDIVRFYGSSWAQVKLSNGTTGYVCTDYLSFEDTSSSSNNNSSDTVTISETSKTMKVGTSYKLTATASSGGTISWKSSDKSIVYVTSLGYINASKEGTVTITATDSKTQKTAACTVKVLKPSADTIKLDSSSKSVDVGSTFTLKATTSPADAKVSWKSSNNSIAKVDSNGLVTAVSGGTATITCSDTTGLVSAKCQVTVVDKEKITLNKTSLTVTAGTSSKLAATKVNASTTIKWTSSNTNVASVNDGVVSGLKSGTATITASDSTGKITATCKVTVNAQTNNGSVSVSHSAATTTAGKTVYIKGYYSRSAQWASSDESIADVYEGFIRTKKAGKAAITYTDTNGNRAICVVTVNEAAPIRFAYSSPNSATLDSTVTLVAITDKTRSKVRFDITVGGQTVTVNATSCTTDGNTYVWKGYYKPTQAGTFTVKAAAYSGSTWKTCDDGKTDIYVTNKKSSTETSLSKLRASDDVIKFIGEKEGFVSYVTYDTLANNIPTLAYGYVVQTGQTFYNGLTKNEGYALLVKAVNNDSYTSRVNTMLVENNIRFNQQQFDALVSFSYNLGTGWTYSSDLKNILLNSYGTVSGNNTVTGTVTAPSGLNLRSQPTTSSTAKRVLSYGEKVTLVSTQKYNSVWYQVKTSDGTTGYCSGTYLNLTTSGSVGRDLKYVNKNALIKEMLSYHHAGGVCYYGLLYRRADELEMFLYGDYNADGRSNKYNFPNPSCISW